MTLFRNGDRCREHKRAQRRAQRRDLNRARPGGSSAPARPALGYALALCCVAALASGCGIRSTSVPVDAGAAPSRVGCVLPDEAQTTGADSGKGNGMQRIYLVCGSRVSPVERRVGVRESRGAPADRLTVARKLLAALASRPYEPEKAAGFDTAVPDGLKVSAPHADDPDGTLRLNAPLEKLPSFALAQIVCTYADASALGSPDRSVILGGPTDVSGLPQRFECSSALRTRPSAAATAGTRVEPPG